MRCPARGVNARLGAPPDSTQWIEAGRPPRMDGARKAANILLFAATITPGSETTTQADLLSSEW